MLKIKSTGIDSTISIFFYPSRSLSQLFAVMAINQFQNLSIFLLFSRQPNRVLHQVFFFFYDFRIDFLIKIIAIELISPSWYYYIQIFTFPYPNPSIRYFFYFSRFRSFESLFLISLFFLGLEFCPYFVIRFEYFELLRFLFLNLKCYVKIEFVVLCIACFQCD